MALTVRQRHVVDNAMEPGIRRSIAAVCEAAGVSRDTFYRWLRDDAEFREAWEAAWRGSIRRHLPGVVAAMIERALSGDVKAARLVADMAGVITRQAHVSIDVAVRREVERVAAELGLDPAEVMAEAEAILRSAEL